MTPETLDRVDAWWRAANYLSIGQIYLLDNPLLREPLRREHVKSRLLGHWGTTPGLNFLWAHLNRAIQERDLDTLFVCGPGHGGPGMVASAWLDGTYSELYPEVDRTEAGIARMFRRFSFPGGIPSHASPDTPGSIHEGGELGYSLSHAYGAAFDNPDLLVACVVGDGEAETGALATGWHSNKFLDPRQDGVVLPILHLNGYKIANPTVLARIPEEELLDLMRGYGYDPYVVSGGFDGEDPRAVHERFAATLDEVLDAIREIKMAAAESDDLPRPRWPMIILRTPKGWTGPRKIDDKYLEGYWRAHQVPITDVHENPEHLKLLEKWMRSYEPDRIFADGKISKELQAALCPTGIRRMSANPVANGGANRRLLRMPDFKDYAIDVSKRGATMAASMSNMAGLLRDVMAANPHNFRLFGPDETESNKLGKVYEVGKKVWMGEYFAEDEDGGNLAMEGRVMEMLSEHTCEGWLEGYILSGRHGLLNSYEPFIHVIDSMVNQVCCPFSSSPDIPV